MVEGWDALPAPAPAPAPAYHKDYYNRPANTIGTLEEEGRRYFQVSEGWRGARGGEQHGAVAGVARAESLAARSEQHRPVVERRLCVARVMFKLVQVGLHCEHFSLRESRFGSEHSPTLKRRLHRAGVSCWGGGAGRAAWGARIAA